tara:strand:+ start:1556 stop:2635 length:1080 start_codon:yes stop_codon:yes gene_type:complete
MFFSKKIKISLSEFLTFLKSGNNNILRLLDLKKSSFNSVPLDQILNNPADIAAGVTAVYTKFNIKVFNLFDNMLIKSMDNGDEKYIFYTSTKNPNQIIEIAKTVYSTLGTGYYDSEALRVFDDRERISNFTKGVYTSDDEDIMNLWLLDEISILLQYKKNPKYEFSLFVTKIQPKTVDRTSRKKGTIASLLKTDFSSLFLQNEDSKTENTEDDGSISSIKYYYYLDPKEFNIFDQLEIQQPGIDKDISFKKPTHFTFSSSENIPLSSMVEFAEKLIKIYGPDNSGSENLELHELDILENREFWTGRNWDFNDIHGLVDIDNPDEKRSYSVWLSFDNYDFGFKLIILSYHNLMDYFVVDE